MRAVGEEDALRVTVLGSATPYPAPDNACSGYLVSGGGVRVWVDAGTGTLAQLQRHVPLGELDAVWVSHLHADHSADLLTAYYALRYADIRRAAPLPLFGPPGIADRLAGFLTNGPERSPIESAFAVVELSDGQEARLPGRLGGLALTSRAVAHGGLPAFGLRVESADGRVLAYSGDTGPGVGLTELAQGCGLLLCEADWSDQPADAAERVHCTPEDAARAARDGGVGRLVVTHVGRDLGPARAVARAAAGFPGPVAHADPGAVFEVPG